jgi:tRNA-specific 2-thiouridylase
MLTPVGLLTKNETRDYARTLGLSTADKPESVEICFVPDGDYVTVLEQHLPADDPALTPGPIVTSAGTVIGQHQGYARYTIGQRRGLPGGAPSPLYVVALRPERREVVVGPAEELAGHVVELEEINWLSRPLVAGDECEVQIRYRSRAIRATVVEAAGDRLKLALATPGRAITPGQSGVLYSGDQMLGGGVIAAAQPTRRELPIMQSA